MCDLIPLDDEELETVVGGGIILHRAAAEVVPAEVIDLLASLPPIRATRP